MKIPAHLLSPMPSNGKSAQNAPLQSVAEFLNEQSETPKDFFSAMKSLQNLVKPPKDNDQQMGQSKDNVSPKANPITSKVAELKFADLKNENIEPREPGQDVSPEWMPPKDIETPKNQAQPIAKTGPIEKSVSLDNGLDGLDLAKTTDQSEHLPTKPDAVQPDRKPLGRVDVGIANNIGTRAAVELGIPANSMPQTREDIKQNVASTSSLPRSAETIVPAVERNSLETVALRPNAIPGNDSAASIAQPHRSVPANDENLRRGGALPLGPTTKTEAKPVDQVPVPQNYMPAKSEAALEAPLQQSNQRAETQLEFKPNLENKPQIQIKDAAVLQSNITNVPAMQPAPPPAVAAKDISTQVTRHLNSELLNMDLRTQIVSERAATGAINSSVLTLQLHPIGLGRVQAEIRKDGDLVRIKLTVEAKGTFEILKNDIDVLKAAMRALGTSEGDVMLTQGNINRLPSADANNGQNFFANERNNQSEMHERENQDPNSGAQQQQSGDEQSAPLVRSPSQTVLSADNTVTI